MGVMGIRRTLLIAHNGCNIFRPFLSHAYRPEYIACYRLFLLSKLLITKSEFMFCTITSREEEEIKEIITTETNEKTFGNFSFVCSHCKHWKQNTFYDYKGAVNDGFCSELASEIEIELLTGWGGGLVKSIETKSTFGCVSYFVAYNGKRLCAGFAFSQN